MFFFLCRFLLLFVVPGMAVPPEHSISFFQVIDISNLEEKLRNQLLGYDEILHLLDVLENESLDDRYTSEQLNELVEFVVMLAQKGTIDDPLHLAALEEDVFYLKNELNNQNSFFYSYYGSVQFCKHRNWFGKRCHSVGKFVKKHKTEIIIGTAVVVAAVVVTVAVVAVAGISAGTSVVAAAGGAASITSSKESADPSFLHSEMLLLEKAQDCQQIESANSLLPITSLIPQMVEQNADEMKLNLIGASDLPFFVSTGPLGEKTLRETAREYSSLIAHQTLSAINELIEPFPQFFSEVKDLGSKILPNNFNLSETLSSSDPLKLHKERVHSFHNKIDELFGTNYAGSFSSESKVLSTENSFAIAILPPLPGNGFFGKKGWELKNPLFQARQNLSVTIEGRVYRGHAIDQMRNRGIPPSVVENTIRNGELININKNNGTLEYFDKCNNIKVVVNEFEEVVTAMIMGN